MLGGGEVIAIEDADSVALDPGRECAAQLLDDGPSRPAEWRTISAATGGSMPLSLL